MLVAPLVGLTPACRYLLVGLTTACRSCIHKCVNACSYNKSGDHMFVCPKMATQL